LNGTRKIGRGYVVRNLAGRIDSSSCTMLASAPGLMSLNFLTGKPGPRAIDFGELSAIRIRVSV
jgi:hypothetical protein